MGHKHETSPQGRIFRQWRVAKERTKAGKFVVESATNIPGHWCRLAELDYKPHARTIAKAPRMRALLRELLDYQREAFENDADLNGADLVVWFAEFRLKVARIAGGEP